MSPLTTKMPVAERLAKIMTAWREADALWHSLIGEDFEIPLATVIFQWFASQSWEGAAKNGMSQETIDVLIERIRVTATTDVELDDSEACAQLDAIIQTMFRELLGEAEESTPK